jgi:putative DNA primase/helicase
LERFHHIAMRGSRMMTITTVAGENQEIREPQEPLAKANGHDRSTQQRIWPKPRPLPNSLPPVDSFDLAFVPEGLKPWVEDIANRLQCPIDYVVVTAIVALGSVIGRRVGIKPQQKTDWVEIPNMWGGFIGRPGMLKSPAMQEALKPLHRLEGEAEKDNEIACEAYRAGLSAYKVQQQVKIALQKDALKKGRKIDEIDLEVGAEPKEPAAVRYRTNDSSYEALGELLRDNPSGILVERDELVSLLKHLDREEQVVARGFYLSGWSGTQSYSFDRIGRGHIALGAVCVSVLGGTQPARIVEYVRRANFGNAGGDGLIQRFGLLVWPDVSAQWRNIDQYPNREAREKAWQVFEHAAKLDLSAALRLGALKGQFDDIPCFRFDDEAGDDFLGWRTDFEKRLRGGELPAAFEGHLAKYRTLVPALALINHIADGGKGEVPRKSLLRALAFSTYLESHAKRIYGSSLEGEVSAAKGILKHISAGDLKDGFTAREIHQHGWAHLSQSEDIVAGLSLLVDLDYLAESHPHPGPQGGRPKVTYLTNPHLRT